MQDSTWHKSQQSCAFPFLMCSAALLRNKVMLVLFYLPASKQQLWHPFIVILVFLFLVFWWKKMWACPEFILQFKFHINFYTAVIWELRLMRQWCYSYEIKHSLNPFPLNSSLLPEMFIPDTICLVKTNLDNCMLGQVSPQKEFQGSGTENLDVQNWLCLFVPNIQKQISLLRGLIFLVPASAFPLSLYFFLFMPRASPFLSHFKLFKQAGNALSWVLCFKS